MQAFNALGLNAQPESFFNATLANISKDVLNLHVLPGLSCDPSRFLAGVLLKMSLLRACGACCHGINPVELW